MTLQRSPRWTILCALVCAFFLTLPVLAEDEEDDMDMPEESIRRDNRDNRDARPAEPAQPSRNRSRGRKTKKGDRQYFNENERRVDAGVFHVGFAAGGNFYIEPRVATTTGIPTGDYYKDFGFQGGVYFDHDYSELDENIPLMLRGMLGYKYILNSVHVFTFDGVVRRQFRFSEYASFGAGIGGSAAIWYRQAGDQAPNEEIIFLPSFVVSAGFEFNPFMVDFKWLINRFGGDATITGFELYFGFRL